MREKWNSWTTKTKIGVIALVLLAVAIIGGSVCSAGANADGLVPIGNYWLKVAAANNDFECWADDRQRPDEIHCYRKVPVTPSPVICNVAFSGHAPKARAGDGPVLRYRINFDQEGDHSVDGTPHPDGWISCPPFHKTPVPPTPVPTATPTPTPTPMPMPVGAASKGW